MIELPFVFLAGLLGSAHCVGMCGGFALSIGASTESLSENVFRQSLYTAGRVFTYSTLGAAAGFGGLRLMQLNTHLPAWLAIVAGLFLIFQGLVTTGLLPKRNVLSKPPCLAASFFGTLLQGGNRMRSFLAGLVTGFLPCGLLYGMLAGAASTSNLSAGAVMMAAFGFGTMPVMVLTGCSGSLVSLVARRRLFYVAGWCVIITGAITLSRGGYRRSAILAPTLPARSAPRQAPVLSCVLFWPKANIYRRPRKLANHL